MEGKEVFRRAVRIMVDSATKSMAHAGVTADDIALVVPHQANLRIIEAVAKRAGMPMDKVFLNVHRYGNMSAGTVPVALVEALEEGRVEPNSLLLLPAFGAGLTWCAHLVRWGDRVTPKGTTDVDLPPCDKTALELVQDYIRRKDTDPYRQ
jgi:3-oxoacyl-[acyl-carrier-protein] synthase-3